MIARMEKIGVQIRRVTLDEILDLRHRLLRQGLPREAAIFDGDRSEQAAHFGAFDDGALVGCATLHGSKWENNPAWQLRGMAVTESHQKRGVGRQLLRFIDSESVNAGDERRLWCNARVPAAPFYEKLGWVVVSEVFEIPTAGPHVRMLRLPVLRT